MVEKMRLTKQSEDRYVNLEHHVVLERAQPGTIAPNGNPIGGLWCLYRNDVFVDYGQYRYDLAEKHNLKI